LVRVKRYELIEFDIKILTSR